MSVTRLMTQAARAFAATNAAAPTGLRNTGRVNLGPATVNLGKGGAPTSVSLHLGPARFRVWDAKGRPSAVTSVDLPGPFSYRPPQGR